MRHSWEAKPLADLFLLTAAGGVQLICKDKRMGYPEELAGRGIVTRRSSFSPARVADRLEIEDVLHHWCRAIDRRDYEGIRAVYHPDALDSHSPAHFEGNVDALITWIRDRHETIPFALHAISNLIIEFAGPDDAVVEAVVTTVQHYPADGDPVILKAREARPETTFDMIAFARYVDHFRRRDDEWRIQRRMVVMDSQMLVEVGGGAMAAGARLGRRDLDDPIYQMRREFGL
jgi:hypothetical protein